MKSWVNYAWKSTVLRSKAQTPQPVRLVGDVHVALQHHLLDIAKAQVEAKVQPYTVGNNLAREAVATVTRGC
jgi:hypothetical protein